MNFDLVKLLRRQYLLVSCSIAGASLLALLLRSCRQTPPEEEQPPLLTGNRSVSRSSSHDGMSQSLAEVGSQAPVQDQTRNYSLQAQNYANSIEVLQCHLYLKLVSGLAFQGSVRYVINVLDLKRLHKARTVQLAFRGYRVYFASINGVRCEPQFSNGVVTLPSLQLREGTNEIKVLFDSKYSLFDEGVTSFFEREGKASLQDRQCVYFINGLGMPELAFPVLKGASVRNTRLGIIHYKGRTCIANCVRRQLLAFTPEEEAKMPFFISGLEQHSRCPLRSWSRQIFGSQLDQNSQARRLVISKFRLQGLSLERLSFFVGDFRTFMTRATKSSSSLSLYFQYSRLLQVDKSKVETLCIKLHRLIIESLEQMTGALALPPLPKIDVVLLSNDQVKVQAQPGVLYLSTSLLQAQERGVAQGKALRIALLRALVAAYHPGNNPLDSAILAQQVVQQKYPEVVPDFVLEQSLLFYNELPSLRHDYREIDLHFFLRQNVLRFLPLFNSIDISSTVQGKKPPPPMQIRTKISDKSVQVQLAMQYLVFYDNSYEVTHVKGSRKFAQPVRLAVAMPYKGELVASLLRGQQLKTILRLQVLNKCTQTEKAVVWRSVVVSVQAQLISPDQLASFFLQSIIVGKFTSYASLLCRIVSRRVKQAIDSKLVQRIFQRLLRLKIKEATLFGSRQNIRERYHELAEVDPVFLKRQVRLVHEGEVDRLPARLRTYYPTDDNVKRCRRTFQQIKGLSADKFYEHGSAYSPQLERVGIVLDLYSDQSHDKSLPLPLAWTHYLHLGLSSAQHQERFQLYKRYWLQL